MAAGLGFKTFTTGEVLTAGDVNGYLMQGVLVFATAAARNSAITSPQEGQFAFTKDTNGLWYYDGAAWVASGATGDIEGVTAGVGITGGGTSGTVTVTNDMATTITTAGDLIKGTGSGTYNRLGIGSTGQVLTVASGAPSWATPASGATYVGCSVSNSASQSITNATDTIVTFDTEQWDTNTIHSTATNTGRFTVPTGYAGKWRLSGTLNGDTSGTNWQLYIFVNGTAFITGFPQFTEIANGGGTGMFTLSYELNLAVADYIELKAYQNSGGAANIRGQYSRVFFSYIGA